MRSMNRMNYLIVGISLLVIALAKVGCGSARLNSNLRSARIVRSSIYSKPVEWSVFDLRDVTSYSVLTPLHMSLLHTDYLNRTYSGAAERWVVSDDAKTYVFSLNTHLKFHNGESFDCGDVQYSFDRLSQLAGYAGRFANILEYKCVNSGTFKMVLKRRSASFLDWIASLETSIIPRSNGMRTETLVGLGPYRFTGMSSEGLPELTRVDTQQLVHSWSPQRVGFKYFESAVEAVRAFDRSEVDTVNLKGDPSFSAHPALVKGMYYDRVWLTTFGKRTSCFKRTSDRLRLSAAVDRIKLFESISKDRQGYAPAFGFVSPLRAGAIEANPVTKGPAAYPPLECGAGSIVEILAVNGLIRPKMIESLTRDFAKIGLKAAFRQLPKSEVVERVTSGDFDTVVMSFGLASTPVESLRGFYKKGSFFYNKGKEKDAELLTIDEEPTATMRDHAVNQFESHLAMNPIYVPLLFEQMPYLMKKCLVVGSRNLVVASEAFQEIGELNGCITN